MGQGSQGNQNNWVSVSQNIAYCKLKMSLFLRNEIPFQRPRKSQYPILAILDNFWKLIFSMNYK